MFTGTGRVTDLSLGFGVLRTLSSSSSSGPLSLGFSNSTLSRSRSSSSTSGGGSAGSCSESSTFTNTYIHSLAQLSSAAPPMRSNWIPRRTQREITHLVGHPEALQESHHPLLKVLLLKHGEWKHKPRSVCDLVRMDSSALSCQQPPFLSFYCNWILSLWRSGIDSAAFAPGNQ